MLIGCRGVKESTLPSSKACAWLKVLWIWVATPAGDLVPTSDSEKILACVALADVLERKMAPAGNKSRRKDQVASTSGTCRVQVSSQLLRVMATP